MLPGELYEEIDAFLQGTLSIKEQEQFLKKVEQMPELKEELALQQNMYTILEAYQKAKWKQEWRKKYVIDSSQEKKSIVSNPLTPLKTLKPKNRSRFFSGKVFFRMAAMLTVITSLLIHFSKNPIHFSENPSSKTATLAKLLDTQFTETSNIAYLIDNNQRSASTEKGKEKEKEKDSLKLIKEAYKYYKSKQYKAALEILSDTTNLAYEQGLLLQGLCYGKLKEYPLAITSLQELLNAQNKAYIGEGTWYLALLYAMNNQEEKSKILLKKVVDQRIVYYNRAKELLKEIEAR